MLPATTHGNPVNSCVVSKNFCKLIECRYIASVINIIIRFYTFRVINFSILNISMVYTCSMITWMLFGKHHINSLYTVTPVFVITFVIRRAAVCGNLTAETPGLPVIIGVDKVGCTFICTCKIVYPILRRKIVNIGITYSIVCASGNFIPVQPFLRRPFLSVINTVTGVVFVVMMIPQCQVVAVWSYKKSW